MSDDNNEQDTKRVKKTRKCRKLIESYADGRYGLYECKASFFDSDVESDSEETIRVVLATPEGHKVDGGPACLLTKLTGKELLFIKSRALECLIDTLAERKTYGSLEPYDLVRDLDPKSKFFVNLNKEGDDET
jgi:hypothetical protein